MSVIILTICNAIAQSTFEIIYCEEDTIGLGLTSEYNQFTTHYSANDTILKQEFNIRFIDGSNIYFMITDDYQSVWGWNSQNNVAKITYEGSNVIRITIRNYFTLEISIHRHIIPDEISPMRGYKLNSDSILLSCSKDYESYFWSTGDTVYETTVSNDSFRVSLNTTNVCGFTFI